MSPEFSGEDDTGMADTPWRAEHVAGSGPDLNSLGVAQVHQHVHGWPVLGLAPHVTAFEPVDQDQLGQWGQHHDPITRSRDSTALILRWMDNRS